MLEMLADCKKGGLFASAPVGTQPSASLEFPLEVTFPFSERKLIESEGLCFRLSIVITHYSPPLMHACREKRSWLTAAKTETTKKKRHVGSVV